MIDMKKTLNLFLVFAIVAFFGCTAQQISEDPSQTTKQILDITIDENPESVILSIKGNQTLTYTSEVERNPRGYILVFRKPRQTTFSVDLFLLKMKSLTPSGLAIL